MKAPAITLALGSALAMIPTESHGARYYTCYTCTKDNGSVWTSEVRIYDNCHEKVVSRFVGFTYGSFRWRECKSEAKRLAERYEAPTCDKLRKRMRCDD